MSIPFRSLAVATSILGLAVFADDALAAGAGPAPDAAALDFTTVVPLGLTDPPQSCERGLGTAASTGAGSNDRVVAESSLLPAQCNATHTFSSSFGHGDLSHWSSSVP